MREGEMAPRPLPASFAKHAYRECSRPASRDSVASHGVARPTAAIWNLPAMSRSDVDRAPPACDHGERAQGRRRDHYGRAGPILRGSGHHDAAGRLSGRRPRRQGRRRPPHRGRGRSAGSAPPDADDAGRRSGRGPCRRRGRGRARWPASSPSRGRGSVEAQLGHATSPAAAHPKTPAVGTEPRTITGKPTTEPTVKTPPANPAVIAPTVSRAPERRLAAARRHPRNSPAGDRATRGTDVGVAVEVDARGVVGEGRRAHQLHSDRHEPDERNGHAADALVVRARAARSARRCVRVHGMRADGTADVAAPAADAAVHDLRDCHGRPERQGAEAGRVRDRQRACIT